MRETDSKRFFHGRKNSIKIINAHGKIPIAYYSVNGTFAEENIFTYNIIIFYLHRLLETGIVTKTLIFDGAANNLSMVSKLGANFNYTDLKLNFNHPSTEQDVHVVLG